MCYLEYGSGSIHWHAISMCKAYHIFCPRERHCACLPMLVSQNTKGRESTSTKYVTHSIPHLLVRLYQSTSQESTCQCKPLNPSLVNPPTTRRIATTLVTITIFIQDYTFQGSQVPQSKSKQGRSLRSQRNPFLCVCFISGKTQPSSLHVVARQCSAR